MTFPGLLAQDRLDLLLQPVGALVFALDTLVSATGQARDDGVMSIRIQAVAIDANDPKAQARWWSEALGWRITYETSDEYVLEPPEGSADDGVAADLLFLKVPEGNVPQVRVA